MYNFRAERAAAAAVACKTTDFKLYYLVKENPLDVITYILIFWIWILTSNDPNGIIAVVVVAAAVWFGFGGALCWFNVDVFSYDIAAHWRSCHITRTHTLTRFCESTDFKEPCSKMSVYCVISCDFFPLVSSLLTKPLNRNWCTDNRIVFSVDKMIWTFSSLSVCVFAYVRCISQMYIVIRLMLEHHHSIDKKKTYELQLFSF